MASTKFTVELDGISIPESMQAEISKEINRVVAKGLAKLDLNAKDRAPVSSLRIIDIINGGRLQKIGTFNFADTIKDLKTLGVNEKTVTGISAQAIG